MQKTPAETGFSSIFQFSHYFFPIKNRKIAKRSKIDELLSKNRNLNRKSSVKTRKNDPFRSHRLGLFPPLPPLPKILPRSQYPMNGRPRAKADSPGRTIQNIFSFAKKHGFVSYILFQIHVFFLFANEKMFWMVLPGLDAWARGHRLATTMWLLLEETHLVTSSWRWTARSWCISSASKRCAPPDRSRDGERARYG